MNIYHNGLDTKTWKNTEYFSDLFGTLVSIKLTAHQYYMTISLPVSNVPNINPRFPLPKFIRLQGLIFFN